jgi:hypothetical protein
LDLIEGFEADEELESCECDCNLKLEVLIAVFFLVRMDLEGECLGRRQDALSVSGGWLVGSALGRNGRSTPNFFNTVFPISFSLWAFKAS